VTLIAEDIASGVAFLERFAGGKAEAIAGGHRLSVNGAVIEVLSAAGFAMRFGTEAGMHGPARFAAITFDVASQVALREHLARATMPFKASDDRTIILPADANGLLMALEETSVKQ
jgi:hypothetical protein